MTILNAIDANGTKITTRDLWAEKSTWGFVQPLRCGLCRTAIVEPVQSHKRLGQPRDPLFRAKDHQSHKESGCSYASTTPVADHNGSRIGMPIRLEMLPNAPKDLDQSVTTLAPAYPMENPKPRRAFRIGPGPATGRLVVQNADHAHHLIQAVEESIAKGNPPHDLVYEDARIPWENFYFDVEDPARAQALKKTIRTVTHPVAMRFVSTGWTDKAGQYSTHLETAPSSLKWLHLATSAVAVERLPAAGQTALYYGLARDFGPPHWYWIDGERKIKNLP